VRSRDCNKKWERPREEPHLKSEESGVRSDQGELKSPQIMYDFPGDVKLRMALPRICWEMAVGLPGIEWMEA
jgi:hypothetical protein